MLGHVLWRQLSQNHEVWVTLRTALPQIQSLPFYDTQRTFTGINAASFENLTEVFRLSRPEAVINCVGIIKHLPLAKDPIASLTINSLLPHRLSQLCELTGARLIHVSTDCVFSGRKGNYTEQDVSDAEDLYGRTKYLGELHQPHCVTLRTSIVGRELYTNSGLLEWFLGQEGKVISGYRQAIYSGVTTLELSKIIENVLCKWQDLSGLWHVSGEFINKYQLLKMAQKAFSWNGSIIPEDSIICDRSLDSTRFQDHTGYTIPCWKIMLNELTALKN